MYYASGNYEAFASPQETGGRRSESQLILSVPALLHSQQPATLVRDGQMKGSHVHLFWRKDADSGRCM